MRWFMKKEIKEKYLGIIKSDGKKGILFGGFFKPRRKKRRKVKALLLCAFE
jgi:hypothetical protein